MKVNTLTALAEPNRLRIVEILREGPASVGDITERIPVSQPQVSKHLRVLRQAGIVTVQPVAQMRVYRLEPTPFKELDSWVDSFQRTWRGRLDVMEDLLRGLDDETQSDKSKPKE